MPSSGESKILSVGPELARQAFMFGKNGDGKPVTSTEALAAIAGCHVKTIRKYVPRWVKEREDMFRATAEGALGITLRSEDVIAHNNDMNVLRKEMEKVKSDLKELDKMEEKLANICENFTINSENGDQAIALFDAWLRSQGNRTQLRNEFLKMQKQWTDLSGVRDLKDIETTTAKERAKIAVRKAIGDKKREGNLTDSNGKRFLVFKRSGGGSSPAANGNGEIESDDADIEG
jgi:hypothetical protein